MSSDDLPSFGLLSARRACLRRERADPSNFCEVGLPRTAHGAPMRREYVAEAPQTMVADRRRRPARADTTAATIPSRYARCQCSAATATHDAQKLDELAPRLGGNHDAQDESRQADRQCTSRSVAFRKVHSRVRHFGGVLVEMVESWLPTTVSDMREKQNRLSACCLHETGMRLS